MGGATITVSLFQGILDQGGQGRFREVLFVIDSRIDQHLHLIYARTGTPETLFRDARHHIHDSGRDQGRVESR
jgi:hypothetical protein